MSETGEKKLNMADFFATAVSEFAGDTHKFISAECSLSQLDELFMKLHELSVSKSFFISIVKISIYAESFDFINQSKTIIYNHPWLHLNTIEFVLQKPASGAQIGLQAWQVCRQNQPIHSSSSHISWAFNFICAAVGSETSFINRFSDGWQRSLSDPGFKGFTQDNIVRTWIYIGDINGDSYGGNHYQQINLARKDIFTWFNASSQVTYPASTGIGQVGGSLGLGVLMCKVKSPLKIVSVENENQTSAFYYPASESRIPPLFSRAIAILSNHRAFLIISGTASILESQSIHSDSLENQVLQTLDNMEKLINSLGLTQSNLKGLDGIRSCIVYIKNENDYVKVKELCEERLPRDAVVNYNIADVCRPELLVEIEAIAIT